MSKPLVAYYRVSTREQGRSGLGIDAQRAAVARFAEAEGFEIVAEFTEVETGKGADALERCRRASGSVTRATATNRDRRHSSRGSWFRRFCRPSSALHPRCRREPLRV